MVLPPFEMAVRDAGVKSVMNSYADVDGVPPIVDRWLLTDLLRDTWGFAGTVVSDYYAVLFARQMHAVAKDNAGAARLALQAGCDVELPQTDTFTTLIDSVHSGDLSLEVINQAVQRCLRHKVELGLLDAEYAPAGDPDRDLDSETNREIARAVAQSSLVLLSNDGLLPLKFTSSKVALIGPCADDPRVLMGCYAFPNHVLSAQERAAGYGLPMATLREAVGQEFTESVITYAPGCTIPSAKLCAAGVPPEESAMINDAVAVASVAEVAIVAVGDIAGLFGEGTSGEGCDAPHLELPGQQRQLVNSILATGTSVILVVISGRPYALGDLADRCAAVIQSFFPGVEGGTALAQLLSGRAEPSGRLPVSVPASPFGGHGTYRTPNLGRNEFGISNIDTAPAFAFGHGLTYSHIEYVQIRTSATQVSTDGELDVTIMVRNVGHRPASEVVQLYASDPVAAVVRPLLELIGFHKVALAPGQSVPVTFTVHTDRFSFTGPDYVRMVEPGEIILRAGPSSADTPLQASIALTGQSRKIPGKRQMHTPGTVRI